MTTNDDDDAGNDLFELEQERGRGARGRPRPTRRRAPRRRRPWIFGPWSPPPPIQVSIEPSSEDFGQDDSTASEPEDDGEEGFLSGAPVRTTAPPRDGPAARRRRPLIIDCHCHAGTGDGLTGPWDTAAPLDGYLRRAAAAGIHRTIVFAAFSSDYAAANREVAGLVRRHPDRLWGFAFVNPMADRGRVRALVETAVRRYGFRGIKLHRQDGRISREVCETARALRLPVLYDPMGELGTVELVAAAYPDVSFIIPHLSSFADDWRAQVAFVDQLARLPNLYTDTSGVRRFDLLERAVRRAGPHKVLFGTDGPWLHPAVELAKIRALGLTPQAESLVLGGNVLRLMGQARPRLLAETTGLRTRRAGLAASAAPGR